MWRTRQRAYTSRRRLERQRDQTRPGASAHDHDMETAASAADPSAELRKFELALTDANEDQGRLVRSLYLVGRERDLKRLDARERASKSVQRRRPIAEARLVPFAYANKIGVDANRAGVQKQASVHQADVDALGAPRLGDCACGVEIGGDTVVAREVVECPRRN